MMRLLLALVVSSIPLEAQNALYLDLKGDWRVIHEDRPEFASPTFDDRAWQSLTLPTGDIEPFQQSAGWLRKQIELPAGADRSSLVLSLGTIQNVYEVHVNGQRIGGSGDFHTFAASQIPHPRSFDIPAAVAGGTPTLLIAIRAKWVLYPHPDWEMPDRGPYRITSRALAPLDAGEREFANWRGVLAPSLAFGVAYSLIALLSLLAFWGERERKELFWFAMVSLAYVFNDFYVLSQLHTGAEPYNRMGVSVPGIVIGCLIYPLFAHFVATAFGFTSRWLRVALWMGWGILPFSVIFERDHVSATLWGNSWPAVLAIGLVLWDWRRLNWGRTSLADHAFHLALLLQAIGYAELWMLPIGNVHSRLPWAFYPGPYRVNREDLFWLVASTAILGLLIRSVAADRRDRQRLAGELQAGRAVQQMLIGARDLDTGDWKVEAAYLPSLEVGGDFYQAVLGDDGSILLVVGDVSGKGLQAAMLVATVIGALGNPPSRAPGSVLAHLNSSLRGKSRGGFVTACCALFHSSGRVDVANAGNLSPYLDGREVELEAGLPLGLVPDAEYAEGSLDLGRGTMTFLSDGVVEAANAQGELFGFDRTREISGKAAGEIAEAAKAWGQNDDITVVTVRRNG